MLVYVPVAHWVWNPQGWLAQMGALDYAGGLVVEIVSGASGLALALVLGQRMGFKAESMRPHNLPFVLLGVGLLWFGWFGFNAGSALAADGMASQIDRLCDIALSKFFDNPAQSGETRGVCDQQLPARTRRCLVVGPRTVRPEDA